MTQSLFAFAALSQSTRLEVLRALIKAGQEGMIAGDIADLLAVRQNTLSTNLTILLRAGLVRNQREGRAVRYYAHFEGIRGLVGFLLEDCCGGNSEMCQPLLQSVICDC